MSATDGKENSTVESKATKDVKPTPESSNTTPEPECGFEDITESLMGKSIIITSARKP